MLAWLFAGLLGAAVQEKTLDAFEYVDAAAARKIWVATERSQPVDVVRVDGRQLVRIPVPFKSQPKAERVVIDRKVKLDLASYGELVLQMRTEDPVAAGRVTLYFRSGDGWYGASAQLHGTGWQSLRFPKRSYRREEKPTGWHAIDGIRIALWKSAPADTTAYVRQLTAQTHEIAVVVRPADKHSESRAAQNTAELFGELLDELGLGADFIEESLVSADTLGKRRVVILPYNWKLDPRTVKALEKYVGEGGKLFACYSSLSSPIARLLGMRRSEYSRQKYSGQFAEMRFESSGIPGLPGSVRQASGNIIAAEPADERCQVIGWWYDDKGKPTGKPALLLSDRGVYLSHILLGDDRAGKRQLLAALVGKLAPSLWQTIAEASLARVPAVGHCGDLASLTEFVAGSKSDRAQAALEEAKDVQARAERQLQSGAYPECVEQATKAHAALAEAYLSAQPSLADEGRAVWNHSGTGAYAGDWERSAKNLAAGGINMILPNMLWGGLALYPSKVLPVSPVVAKYGDQVALCVAAAKRHGLEVHVWKVNWNLGQAPKDFVERMRRAERLQMSVRGEPVNWLCPSHPENQALELQSLLEVARNYAIDGLHFDYIRYPNRDSCYCSGCRQRFEKHSGQKVEHWPEDVYSGKRRTEYNDWRCAQITTLVANVRRESQKIRPGLKLSAAVFSSYPSCRDSIAQDWLAWVKADYLDFLCPMDYTSDDKRFVELITKQLQLVGGRIPIYPGIGATSSNSSLTADRVVGQIHYTRTTGAAGFTIFNYSAGTAETIIPKLSLSTTAQSARPPHRQSR